MNNLCASSAMAARFSSSQSLSETKKMTSDRKFDNTNRGAIFRNEKESETDRDYGGSLNVNGTEFWISGWVRTSAKGTKYLSLAIKQKDDTKPKDTANK
jgi:hypothetical protein